MADVILRQLLRKFRQTGGIYGFEELNDDELRYLVNEASKILIKHNSPRMQYWIVTYQHRQGTDHYIHYSVGTPALAEIIPHHYEGERTDEFLDIDGPYEMWDPTPHGDQSNFQPTSDFGLFFEKLPEDPKYPFPSSGLCRGNYTDDYDHVDESFDACPACNSKNITLVPEDDGYILVTCGDCSFRWAEPDEGWNEEESSE